MSKTLQLKVKKSLSSRLSEKKFRSEKFKNKCESAVSPHVVETEMNFSNDIGVTNLYSELLYKISKNTPVKLDFYFFNHPCITVAKTLLGKILVRKLDTGQILKGRIVETECYLGWHDKASHSYQGKRTERNEAMFMEPGTAYVYTIYGMYYCFNISSMEDGSAVLIRALEPLENASTMLSFRSIKRKSSSMVKEKDLCNGPSKLCQSFKIEKLPLNKVNLCNSNDLWLEEGSEISECDIVSCKRIGIDSAGEEWANKPLRFYIRDCKWVSVRNKVAEQIKVNVAVAQDC